MTINLELKETERVREIERDRERWKTYSPVILWRKIKKKF